MRLSPLAFELVPAGRFYAPDGSSRSSMGLVESEAEANIKQKAEGGTNQ